MLALALGGKLVICEAQCDLKFARARDHFRGQAVNLEPKEAARASGS